LATTANTLALKLGMVGQVVKASDNVMAAQVSAATGLEFSAAWVLVDFGNGMRIVVRNASDLRRIKVQ